MFQTVHFTQQLNTQSCVILLGGFDGLHVGHRLLLSRAKEYGVPVGVMTIVGAKQGGSLFTFAEREKIFRMAGVDFAFELPFSEIKDLSPNTFIALIEKQFSPIAFVCGEDFRFGRGAQGDAALLKRITNVKVDVLPLLEKDGQKVSSSTVKKLLSEKDLPQANTLLSEPYFLMGTVKEGRKVGRLLGFPTANITYPEGKFTLPHGVYETAVEVGGKTYKAITNFGAQPTFLEGQVCVETHLGGFVGNLYGQMLTIRFLRFLRPIQRFENAEALKAQLVSDLQYIRGDKNGN